MPSEPWKREETMIGLDTGFFVELMRGNDVAVRAWKALVEGEGLAVVSCLSLLEIERLGARDAIKHADALLEAIPAVCLIKWIHNTGLLSTAAGLGSALDISAFDSIILASFLEEGVNRIYTTNVHLENYRKKGVEVITLRRSRGKGQKTTVRPASSSSGGTAAAKRRSG